MAVKPANSNYHTFTFNGVRAADYGIYVTDVNVFNSAARDVEYIQIPGRDGAFALDRGRFQNISVVYKCAMTQDTDEDFATAISEFRNAIASTKGYKRLEDDIHTDEYRMGVFSKGLEAPTLNTKTATFDVEFNCQPQRFLKSGETAVSVASGGTLTNPTLFESHPLLQVWGYGGLEINGQSLKIDADKPLGRIIIWDGSIPPDDDTQSFGVGQNRFTTGDTFTLNAQYTFNIYGFSGISSETNVTVTPTGNVFKVSNIGIHEDEGMVEFLAYTESPLEFRIGGLRSYTADFVITCTNPSATLTVSASIAYEPVYNRVVFTTTDDHSDDNAVGMSGTAVGNSTFIPESNTFFDLDIGEAYRIVYGEKVSANNIVTIPAKLPTLKSGVNNITYDDTITQFKIVPRWWEV